MSVLLLAVLALPGGLVTALLAGRRRAAFAVGLATAVACVVLAASIDAADTVPIAGSVIGGSDGLRTLAVAWALSTLIFGVVDALLGDGPAVLGPALIGLGVGAVGLSAADAGIGFTLLTAGAILAAVVPIGMVHGGTAAAPGLGLRALRPLLAAGGISLVAVAWGASAVGPFATLGVPGQVDPALANGLGLALLAIAAASAIRLGAVPAHAWAARYAEAMPASAVPPVLGWGAAAFVLVAFGWLEVTVSTSSAPLSAERGIIVLVAVASVILGGIAALVHDDVEHVLAYSIVQDAGITLLAISASGATAAAAGRDWILAAVAVKSGLAAWVLVTRATFGSHRQVDLRGWARRSPILGLALALVLLGAVGLPGMASFEARATLIRLAVPGPLAMVVLLAAFAPVVFIGRLLVGGVDAMAEPVRSATHATARIRDFRGAGWADDDSPLRAVPAAVRANRYPLAAVGAVLAAILGLSVAIGGLGSTTVSEGAGAHEPSSTELVSSP
jgi:NADH-quinone oxidoreductase subunit N